MIFLLLACDSIAPYKDLPIDSGAPAQEDTGEVVNTESDDPDQNPLESLLELPCAQYARKDFLEIGVVYVEDDLVSLGFSLYGISVDEDQISGAARASVPDGGWVSMVHTGSAYAAKVATEAVQDCEMLFWAPSGV